jgi:hypothetical protein
MTEQRLSFSRLALGYMVLLAASTHLLAQATAPSSQPASSKEPAFRVCPGTYALCTKATCEPDGRGGFSCTCDVMQGLSAGAGEHLCKSVPLGQPKRGMRIPSRYYPIRSYVACPSPKETATARWAWCLDMPCRVDKNRSKAHCSCTKPKTIGAYVFVTDSYHLSGCESEIISSATVAGVEEITEFLKTSPLQPFPIKVLEPPK